MDLNRREASGIAKLQDCSFYQSIEIPGHGHCEGIWDHRSTVDAFLGYIDVKGKTVLDAGPANGFFTFEMEKRGAEVTALDLGEAGDWDAVPNAHAPWQAEDLREQLRHNVRGVENAFWVAHQANRSRARLVYGSIYDTPSVVNGKVDIALMSNVLQHLRDPFLAIQRVSQVVRRTMIVTEAIWHDEQAFLDSTDMRFLPRLEEPYLGQSWWLVPPRLVMEILKLLGFGDLKCGYHDEWFNGTLEDRNPRMVRHYTVTGIRLDYTWRFVDGWHDSESNGTETWRWSGGSQATVAVDMAHEKPLEGQLRLKIGAAAPAGIVIKVNGHPVSRFDCSGPPEFTAVKGVSFQPGANLIEFQSDKAARQLSSADPRPLGFALYQLGCVIA